MLWRKKKVALALGGGAARGMAHLGVLKVLEEHGLIPDLIVGTSFGALIGAAYASKKYSISDLIDKLRFIIYSDEFKELGIGLINNIDRKKNIRLIKKLRSSFNELKFYHALFKKKYIVANSKFEKVVRLLLPDINIEDLPLKFGTVALDLRLKQEYLMDKGSLIKSVLASCCIPGIFQPVKMNNTLLVDGGWVNNVPVPFARRLGADKIMAVDVSNPFLKKIDYKSGLGLLWIADNITSKILKNYQILTADLVISPIVKKVEWFEFNRFNKIVEYGEKSALKHLDQIKKVFKKGIFYMSF